MPLFGTTKRQQEIAVSKLKSAGIKSWGVAQGHHYLWVTSARAFPTAAGNCGRVAVPDVDKFLKNFA